MTDRATELIEKLSMMERPLPTAETTIDNMIGWGWDNTVEMGWVIHHVYGLTVPDACHRVTVRRTPVVGECAQWRPNRDWWSTDGKHYCKAPVRTFKNGSTFCDKGHKDPAVKESARVARWSEKHGKKAVSVKAVKTVLAVLYEAKPEPLSCREIGRRAGYSHQYVNTVLKQELLPCGFAERPSHAGWRWSEDG